jgi:hypothetical protein
VQYFDELEDNVSELLVLGAMDYDVILMLFFVVRLWVVEVAVDVIVNAKILLK